MLEHGKNLPRQRSSTDEHGRNIPRARSSMVECGRNIPRARSKTIDCPAVTRRFTEKKFFKMSTYFNML